MFNSLVSLIFGNNKVKDDHLNPNLTTQQSSISKLNEQLLDRNDLEKDTIHVTSLSPSVSGDAIGNNIAASNQNNIIATKKRSKSNKRNSNRQRNNNKLNTLLEQACATDTEKVPVGERSQHAVINVPETKSSAAFLAELLTAPAECCEDNQEDDEWILVQCEDDELESLSLKNDSEEELEQCVLQLELRLSDAAVEEKENIAAINTAANANIDVLQQQQRRRQQLIDAQALYNGPRHKQQRNYLQRKRNASLRTNGNTCKLFAVKAASVERDVPLSPNEREDQTVTQLAGMTQSVCFGDVYDNNASMDDSWFITPPPCFTSIGPINMVSSPFENLLIEHPSMSVYHSIRSILSVERRELAITDKSEEEIQQDLPASVPQNSARPRVERFKAAQLKQEFFTRNAQKSHLRQEHQNLCRGAIKRSNKLREVNSNSRARRADLQNTKMLSGTNNNRKICC